MNSDDRNKQIDEFNRAVDAAYAEDELCGEANDTLARMDSFIRTLNEIRALPETDQEV